MVKGDSREFSIAAASIIAKVTRDRIMHGYDAMYPKFLLGKHKGYPTAAHMAAVRSHGASPIHRRTFAPLKHMNFDEDGQIISAKNK
jgi:ribonuclease HII